MVGIRWGKSQEVKIREEKPEESKDRMTTQSYTHILLKKEVAEGHFQRRQEYQQMTRAASDDKCRPG